MGYSALKTARFRCTLKWSDFRQGVCDVSQRVSCIEGYWLLYLIYIQKWIDNVTSGIWTLKTRNIFNTWDKSSVHLDKQFSWQNGRLYKIHVRKSLVSSGLTGVRKGSRGQSWRGHTGGALKSSLIFVSPLWFFHSACCSMLLNPALWSNSSLSDWRWRSSFKICVEVVSIVCLWADVDVDSLTRHLHAAFLLWKKMKMGHLYQTNTNRIVQNLIEQRSSFKTYFWETTSAVLWVPCSHPYPQAMAQAAREATFREYHPSQKVGLFKRSESAWSELD